MFLYRKALLFPIQRGEQAYLPLYWALKLIETKKKNKERTDNNQTLT